jgi:glycosyltransferase involved in cell wall biosynthesis
VIVHLNTSKEWRGGENQVLNLARGLKAESIQQLIVTQPDSPLSKKAKDEGIETIELSMRGEFDFKAILALRKIFKEKNVQLVHTHTAHAHSLAVLAKTKKDNFALIVSRRVDFRIKKNLFSLWKYKSPKVDLFIGVSRQIQKYLLEDGIDSDRAIAIHSGIDVKKFKKIPSSDSLRKSLDISKKTIVIGIIAALVDHKDHATFLRSIAGIHTDVPFTAVILGEGKLESKLKDLAQQLQIQDRVLFQGFQDNIPEYLSLIDIFTLTSKEEGLGTSILDAMAAGKPVVATRAGGIPEMVVPNHGGILCDIGSTEQLAQAYKTLIESPDLRKQYADFNKIQVEKFSFENMVQKTIQVYRTYLGNKI